MEDIKQKIRIFSTPTCPYCVTLKEFLKEKNFEFEDIDVSKDETALQEMTEKTKQFGVPVIDINGEFVVGFDREKICQLLNIE
ncbi:MAG: glutaredoxin domain-containing protein [bacterium]|nr:glutaredoxin domain-containing protein [bacterium]